MHPPGESSCPSSTKAQMSSAILPDLMRGIKRFLEGRLADANHRVGQLFGFRGAQLEIFGDDAANGGCNLLVAQARPLDLTDGGLLIGPAAKENLIEFFALLIDAKHANVADMVMTTGVDAA